MAHRPTHLSELQPSFENVAAAQNQSIVHDFDVIAKEVSDGRLKLNPKDPGAIPKFATWLQDTTAKFNQTPGMGPAAAADVSMEVPSRIYDPGTIRIPQGIQPAPPPPVIVPPPPVTQETLDSERRLQLMEEFRSRGLMPPGGFTTDELEQMLATRDIAVGGEEGIKERQSTATSPMRMLELMQRMGEEIYAPIGAKTGMGFWGPAPPEFLEAVEAERARGPMLGEVDPLTPEVRALRETSPEFFQMPIIPSPINILRMKLGIPIDSDQKPLWTLGGAEVASELLNPLNLPPVGTAQFVTTPVKTVAGIGRKVAQEGTEASLGRLKAIPSRKIGKQPFPGTEDISADGPRALENAVRALDRLMTRDIAYGRTTPPGPEDIPTGGRRATGAAVGEPVTVFDPNGNPIDVRINAVSEDGGILIELPDRSAFPDGSRTKILEVDEYTAQSINERDTYTIDLGIQPGAEWVYKPVSDFTDEELTVAFKRLDELVQATVGTIHNPGRMLPDRNALGLELRSRGLEVPTAPTVVPDAPTALTARAGEVAPAVRAQQLLDAIKNTPETTFEEAVDIAAKDLFEVHGSGKFWTVAWQAKGPYEGMELGWRDLGSTSTRGLPSKAKAENFAREFGIKNTLKNKQFTDINIVADPSNERSMVREALIRTGKFDLAPSPTGVADVAPTAPTLAARGAGEQPVIKIDLREPFFADDNAQSLADDLNALGEPNPLNPGKVVIDGVEIGPINVFDGNLRLHSLRSLEPGSGAGTRVLERITQMADEAGVTIEGAAVPTRGVGGVMVSEARLRAFYERHGFVFNDPNDPQKMVRTPRLEAETLTAPTVVPDVAPIGIQNIEIAQTGQPFTGKLFRGSGRETVEEVYDPHFVQGPIFGEAVYASPSREFAGEFGSQIDEIEISLRNPLVISSDTEWRALTRESGLRSHVPIRPEEVTRLRQTIQAKGHDGVIVRVPESEAVGKRLQQAFGEDTVISFDPTITAPTRAGDVPTGPTQPVIGWQSREQIREQIIDDIQARRASKEFSFHSSDDIEGVVGKGLRAGGLADTPIGEQGYGDIIHVFRNSDLPEGGANLGADISFGVGFDPRNPPKPVATFTRRELGLPTEASGELPRGARAMELGYEDDPPIEQMFSPEEIAEWKVGEAEFDEQIVRRIHSAYDKATPTGVADVAPVTRGVVPDRPTTGTQFTLEGEQVVSPATRQRGKVVQAELDSALELDRQRRRAERADEAARVSARQPTFRLPQGLAKSSPRFGRFELAFDSDLDRALYIASSRKRSAARDQFEALLRGVFGEDADFVEIAIPLRKQISDRVKRSKGDRPVQIPKVIDQPDVPRGVVSEEPVVEARRLVDEVDDYDEMASRRLARRDFESRRLIDPADIDDAVDDFILREQKDLRQGGSVADLAGKRQRFLDEINEDFSTPSTSYGGTRARLKALDAEIASRREQSRDIFRPSWAKGLTTRDIENLASVEGNYSPYIDMDWAADIDPKVIDEVKEGGWTTGQPTIPELYAERRALRNILEERDARPRQVIPEESVVDAPIPGRVYGDILEDSRTIETDIGSITAQPGDSIEASVNDILDSIDEARNKNVAQAEADQAFLNDQLFGIEEPLGTYQGGLISGADISEINIIRRRGPGPDDDLRIQEILERNIIKKGERPERVVSRRGPSGVYSAELDRFSRRGTLAGMREPEDIGERLSPEAGDRPVERRPFPGTRDPIDTGERLSPGAGSGIPEQRIQREAGGFGARDRWEGKPRTLADLRRESRGQRAFTPAQRADLADETHPINTKNIAWRIRDYDAPMELLKSQTKVPEYLMKLPSPIRRGLEVVDTARLSRNDPGKMAGIQHNLFVEIEKARVAISVLNFKNRAQKLFSFRKGIARRVEVAEGVSESTPGLRTLDDILDHPEHYVLTPEQNEVINIGIDTQTQSLRDAQRLGVDVIELGSAYWHRIIRKAPVEPAGEPRIIGILRRRKGYTYERALQGIDQLTEVSGKGFVYEQDPYIRMAARLEAAVESMAAVHLQRRLTQLPGAETFGQRISKDVIKAHRKALESLKRARANSLQKGGDSATKLEELRTAESIYLRAVGDLERAGKKAKTPGIGEVILYNRIIPADLKKQVEEFVGSLEGATEPNKITGILSETAQLLRTMLTTADLAAGFIQGQGLFYRNHPKWWTAQVHGVLGFVDDPTAYVARNFDVMQRGMEKGAIMRPTEFLFAERGLASVPPRIPLIGPALKGFNRAFEWFIVVAQTELFKAAESQLLKKGIKGKTLEEELVSVGTAIRKGVGGESPAILGLRQNQVTIERLAFFASRLLRANAGIIAQATLTPGAGGREARRILGSVIAGGTALTIGINLASTGRFPNFTDTDASDWGKFRVGKRLYSAFGPYHPYFRTIARSSNRGARGNITGALREIGRFFRSKASIPVRALETSAEMYTRGYSTTFEGEIIEPSLLGAARLASEHLPIAPVEAAKGIAEGEPSALTEFVGLQGQPESRTLFLQRKAQEITNTDRKLEDLLYPEFITVVQSLTAEETAALAELDRLAANRGNRYAENRIAQSNLDGIGGIDRDTETAVAGRLTRETDLLLDLFGRGQESGRWRFKNGKEQTVKSQFWAWYNAYRIMTNDIYSRKDQDRRRILGEDAITEEERPENDQPNAQALYDLWNINDQITTDTGLRHSEKYWALYESLRNTWTPEQKAFIDEYRELKEHAPGVEEVLDLTQTINKMSSVGAKKALDSIFRQYISDWQDTIKQFEVVKISASGEKQQQQIPEPAVPIPVPTPTETPTPAERGRELGEKVRRRREAGYPRSTPVPY